MSGRLSPMFRMPICFGPAPGPRNLPEDKQGERYRKETTTLSLSARSDPALLAAMLPPGFTLHGEPRINLSFLMFRNIGWLAGRGYNIAIVGIPARWQGQTEETGHFVPVVWESMADPIITGREELGWSKIYADVADLEPDEEGWHTHAEWEGFRFLDAQASGLAPGDPAPAVPMMFAKYIPRTGEWGEADVSYATITAPDGPAPVLQSSEIGTGSFAFHPARWEDMPTQYPIVNALAALPLDDFGPAQLVRTSGGGDGSGQTILR